PVYTPTRRQGQTGARLFHNNIAEPGMDTIINLQRGKVGVGRIRLDEPAHHATASACAPTSSSARSRIWSRSSSSSTFFISSKASLRDALASSSWIFRSWAERLRLSRRWIAALVYVG